MNRRQFLTVTGSLLVAPCATATPLSASIFKPDWWQVFEVVCSDADGANRKHWRFVPALHPSFVLASLDCDALTVWAVFYDPTKHKGCAVLVHAHEWKEGDGDFVGWVSNICDRRRVDCLLVYGAKGITANSRGAFSERQWTVKVVSHGTGFIERAHTVVPMLSDGLIFVPGTIVHGDDISIMDWAQAAIDQIGAFPYSASDGLTRSTVMGLRYLHDTALVG